jgi:hypothetical protein
MKRLYAAAIGALLTTGFATASHADSDTVNWKRIIGIIQAGNQVFDITGAASPGVPSGAKPW